MDWFIAPQSKPVAKQDPVKTIRRTLRHAERDLENEVFKSEVEEKRAIADIRKLAKEKKDVAMKARARDLVRIRRQTTRMQGFLSKVKTLDMQVTPASTIQKMAGMLKQISGELVKMNRSINLDALTKTIDQYQKNMDEMEQKGEAMEQVLDHLDPDQEQDSEEIVNKVLDELGIDLAVELSNASAHAAMKKDAVRLAKLEASVDPLKHVSKR